MFKRGWIVIFLGWWGLTLVQANGCTTIDCPMPQYGKTEAEIAAITPMPLSSLTVDQGMLYDRRYMRLTGTTDVYDTPNGNVIRTQAPGFVYVTVLGDDQGGWTQINGSEWVKTEMVKGIGAVSSFTGIMLPEMSLPYTLAWALVDFYPSAAPGYEAPKDAPLDQMIPRYSVVQIYATYEVDGKRWYQIAPYSWVHQYKVSKIQPLTTLPAGVDTDLWFGIDLYEQNMVMYRGTTPVFTALVATGLDRWPTYEGLFHIYHRNPRELMTWGVVGDDYYLLEEVPWTMFFDEGRALHGAYWHDGFGYRRSHGCVNLSITDAKWVYDQVTEFMQTLPDDSPITGPAVYVYTTGNYQ
jgi:hypothetical protein